MSETNVLPARERPCLKVLNIEDNAVDIDLLRRALERTADFVQLSTQGDGEAALAYLKTYGGAAIPLPDLILLDLNLPRKDGLETLREIKQNPVLKTIPVLILTTSNSQSDITQCYASGASGYLVKPLDFTDLLALVKKTFDFWLRVEVPHN